jgi:transcriptional regulator with XRE-family HTH domain
MTIINKRDKRVSVWLKVELKRLGMTASELAEKLNASGTKVGRATVYYYCSGMRLPSPEIAAALAEALGSKVPEFEQRPVGRPLKPYVDPREIILPDIKFKKRPEAVAPTAQSAVAETAPASKEARDAAWLQTKETNPDITRTQFDGTYDEWLRITGQNIIPFVPKVAPAQSAATLDELVSQITPENTHPLVPE